MAIVTWNGWRKEPNESCKEAYDFLTGRRIKPFIVVFGGPETKKNFPKMIWMYKQNLKKTKNESLQYNH